MIQKYTKSRVVELSTLNRKYFVLTKFSNSLHMQNNLSLYSAMFRSKDLLLAVQFYNSS